MAEPRVSLLLTLVDKLTAPMEGVRGTLGRTGAAFRSLGNEAADLLRNQLFQGVGLYGLWNGLQKSWTAADELTKSISRMAGTAKIAGVPLEVIQQAAAGVSKQFGLSATSANNFASSAVMMAAKAGQVSKAGELMAAVLNIAAARGISAAAALEVLNLTLKGQDEGLDRLLNRNPSAMWKEWAEKNNVAAGSLTDANKRLAEMNGLIEVANRIGPAWNEFLSTAAGKMFLAGEAAQDAQARFGIASESLRLLALGIKTWVYQSLGGATAYIQKIAVDAALMFYRLPIEFNAMVAAFLMGLGSMIEQAASIPVIGEKFQGLADKVSSSGKRMWDDAERRIKVFKNVQREQYAEIEGTALAAQSNMTTFTEDGEGDRLNLTKSGHKAIEAASKKSAENLKALENIAYRSTLELLSAQHRKYLEVTREFQEKMAGMTAADRARAEVLLEREQKKILAAWAGLGDDLIPVVREPTLKVRKAFIEMGGSAVDAGEDVADAGQNFEDFKKKAVGVADAVQNAVGHFLAFADALGLGDSKMAGLVQGIGQLAGAVGKIASGDVLGGLAQGIGAIKNVVGSLFGKSAQEKAVEAALNKNRRSLDRLTEEVGDLNINLTGNQIAGVETALNQFFAKDGGKSKNWGDVLEAELKKVGLTMADLDSVAKELGIDIRPGGHLSPEAIRQVLKGIGLIEPGQFGNDYASRRDQIDAGVKIGTVTDEGKAVTDLGKELSPAIAAALKGIDLTTPEGRAKARTAIQGLFGGLEDGSIGAAGLGGLTGQEFLGILEDIFAFLAEPDAGGSPGGTGTSAPDVSGSAGASFGSVGGAANPDVMAVLEGIATNTKATADSAAELVTVTREELVVVLRDALELQRVSAAANMATAEAIAGNKLATIVDAGLASSYAVTSVNNGVI